MITPTQRLKYQHFLKKKILLCICPFGTAPFEKISKNVDFSLWGKHCGFGKLSLFSDFSLLSITKDVERNQRSLDVIMEKLWQKLNKKWHKEIKTKSENSVGCFFETTFRRKLCYNMLKNLSACFATRCKKLDLNLSCFSVIYTSAKIIL